MANRMVGPLDWSEAAVAWLGHGLVGGLDGRVQPVRAIEEAKLGVVGPWNSSGFGCLGRGMGHGMIWPGRGWTAGCLPVGIHEGPEPFSATEGWRWRAGSVWLNCCPTVPLRAAAGGQRGMLRAGLLLTQNESQ